MPKTIKRRRRDAKTDYKARFAMLKSEKPRLVVRKTNRYIIAQLVDSDLAQDKTIIKMTTQNLLSKGWPKEKAGSLKSLPAAYLLGFMIGKNSKDKIKSAILDTGLHRNVSGSRVYAVLKGAVDAGLQIAHNPEAFPSEERLNSNKELAPLINQIKEKL